MSTKPRPSPSKPRPQKRALVAEKRYGSAKPRKKPKKKKRFSKLRRAFQTIAQLRIVKAFLRVLRLIWAAIWGVSWRLGLIVFVMLALATFVFYTQLPAFDTLLDGRARGSVTFLDDDDKVFAWRGETFGAGITAGQVSPHLRNAIIASEDKRFYDHFGVSPRGIVGAILINLREGRGPLEGHGGSTITQQVAKLLCLGTAFDASLWASEKAYEAECRAGGIWRKIKEIPFSLALEAKYTKDEILSIYLNRAYLGAGARGFEAASQRYFSKSARHVTPAEAAMLAGLLTAPSRFAPTNNLTRAQRRANVVIGLMEEQEYLEAAEAARSRQTPATLSSAAAANTGGAFADWVMSATPSFLSTQTTEDVIVRTTLNPRVQAAVEAAMRDIFTHKVRTTSKAQAAAVVMSADGAVRAMVGGRGAALSGGFNRATQARRQTGSSFKPFVYAAAYDLGYGPFDLIEDSPLTLDIPGSGLWSPKNYSRKYAGIVTLTDALAQSLNIPAVRLSETIGRDAVRAVATGFGLPSDLALGPALALGASEATLLEMTGAYAGILNGGHAVAPYALRELRLKGDARPLIGQPGGLRERIISQEAAQNVMYSMWRVIEDGTGRRARIPSIQAAGKTGTTQAARDAWFIGFTADYVIGVWMGYDDNTPLQGVTGGGLPAEIWREITTRIYEDAPPPGPLPLPPYLQERKG